MSPLSKNETLLLSQLGYTLYKEGQYEKAIHFFEGLSSLQPDYAPFHSLLALLYHLTNNPHAALKEAIESLRLKPNDLAVMITLGEIYLSLNQQRYANEVLSNAYRLARQTEHPSINRIQLLMQSQQEMGLAQ